MTSNNMIEVTVAKRIALLRGYTAKIGTASTDDSFRMAFFRDDKPAGSTLISSAFGTGYISRHAFDLICEEKRIA